jgi:hypothetical protein
MYGILKSGMNVVPVYFGALPVGGGYTDPAAYRDMDFKLHDSILRSRQLFVNEPAHEDPLPYSLPLSYPLSLSNTPFPYLLTLP